MFAFFRHLIVVFFVLMCSIFLYDDYTDYSLTEKEEEETFFLDNSFFQEKKYIIKTDITYSEEYNIFNEIFNFFPNIEEVLESEGRAFYNAMSIEKKSYIVKSGDNIISILKKNNLSKEEINNIIYNLDSRGVFSNLRVGEKIEIGVKLDKLVFLAKKIKNNTFYVLSEGKSGFELNKKEYEIKTQTKIVFGLIESSLYQSAVEVGLSPRQVKQIVDIFKWKFDINNSIQKGDFFIVEYDVKMLFDKIVESGEIKAIYFKTKNDEFYAINYNNNNNTGYYDLEGNNLAKAFNRYPVDSPRITSSFSLNRYHPILKVRRPHKGTDFGGYRGKPIKATGNGRVTYAGRNGGYGNFIKINHGNGYETSYAHLSKILVKKFDNVKRGQIIGHMGSTGRSTGTHLHYEMEINNRPVNAMKIKLPEEPFVGGEKRFKEVARKYKLNFEVIREKNNK